MLSPIMYTGYTLGMDILQMQQTETFNVYMGMGVFLRQAWKNVNSFVKHIKVKYF